MTFDTAIKIWAVAGPLIGAAISAWWNRRVQLQDRAREDEKDMRIRSYAEKDKENDHKRSISVDNINRLKLAYAEFVASANEYALHSSANINSPSKEFSLVAQQALAKLNYNYHLLTLISNQDLSDMATDVLNLSLELGSTHNEEESAELREQFKNTKFQLVSVARNYMSELGA